MRRLLPLAIIGVVLILAFGGGLWLFRWKQQQQPSQTSPLIPLVPEASPAPVTPNEPATPSSVETPAPAETPVPTVTRAMLTPEPIHFRGAAAAPVTLEEFGDFQCAPCGKLFPVLSAVEHHYGDRLRVVFRHMPLRKHEHAPLAARAAEAAGLQGRFWEMHGLLYQNSLRWTKGVDTIEPDTPSLRRLQSNVLAMDIEVRDVFFRYAEILQLDVERFKEDLDSDQVKARVESDRLKGVALGIDRTPTIYVNGHLIPAPSSMTSEGLHAAIDAALAGKVYVQPPTPTPAATRATPK